MNWDPTQWQEIAQYFHDLVDLPQTKQSEALDKLAKENPGYHQEVVKLLKEENAIHPALKTECYPSCPKD